MLCICLKSNFQQKNFLPKFFMKVHRYRLNHQKLHTKRFFRPLVVTHLFEIQFSTVIFLAKFFIKSQRYRLIHQKLKNNRFCPNPGDYTFAQNSMSYKTFPNKFFIKVHKYRIIIQKLNSNGFFRPLVLTHLFKIQFPTKSFLTNFL